jgi:hypothetical protein
MYHALVKCEIRSGILSEDFNGRSLVRPRNLAVECNGVDWNYLAQKRYAVM